MKLLDHDGDGDIETLKALFRKEIEKPPPDNESHDWIELARLRAMEMLRLLDRIEVEIPEQPTWYYRTSHIFLLCFLRSQDDHHHRVLVNIYATGEGLQVAKAYGLPRENAGCFQIEYLIPPDQSPWPEAEIHMRASSVSDALSALRIAFDRCAK